MPVPLVEIVDYLDSYLKVSEFSDWPNAMNGLQVENKGSVSKVVAAVDACQASIDGASQAKADLMLVHHGLFWAGLEPVVGRHARRLRSLIQQDIALYSSHLPLDAHGEVGNNIVLARMLGVEVSGRFGEIEGAAIGVLGTVSVTLDQLVSQLEAELRVHPHVIAGGPDRVRHVGIMTGGAGDMIRQAVDSGCDTFITGEGAHYTHFDAEEWGVNVIYAGHYATETVGVKALAAHIQTTFELPWEFIDHPTGL